MFKSSSPSSKSQVCVEDAAAYRAIGSDRTQSRSIAPQLRAMAGLLYPWKRMERMLGCVSMYCIPESILKNEQQIYSQKVTIVVQIRDATALQECPKCSLSLLIQNTSPSALVTWILARAFLSHSLHQLQGWASEHTHMHAQQDVRARPSATVPPRGLAQAHQHTPAIANGASVSDLRCVLPGLEIQQGKLVDDLERKSELA